MAPRGHLQEPSGTKRKIRYAVAAWHPRARGGRRDDGGAPALPGPAGVEGESTDPAYELAGALEMHVTTKGKSRRRVFRRRDQFAPELLYFSDCILQDREPEPGGAEGLIDVRIIRALYESARSAAPVRLDPVRGNARPGPAQRIDRPPVREPQLVHAKPPR